MTHSDKVRYLQIALAMEGIAVSLKTADIVVTSYDEILIRRGKFKLKDAVRIEREVEHRHSSKVIDLEPEPVLEPVLAPEPEVKTKPKRAVNNRVAEKRALSQTFTQDPSLTGNMLGAWLRKEATVKKLHALNSKYGAGSALRLRTLVLKKGSPDLLHTDIGMVTKQALLTVPRTGEKLWNIFVEARDQDKPNSLK